MYRVTNLEVFMEPVGAAVLGTLTAREVVTKFACSITAVGHELRADRVVHISTGVSYNTGAWYENAHSEMLLACLRMCVFVQNVHRTAQMEYCTC